MHLDCTADVEDVSACLVEVEKNDISKICDALEAGGDLTVWRFCAFERRNRGSCSVAGDLNFRLDGCVGGIDIVTDVGVTASHSPDSAFFAHIDNVVDCAAVASIKQYLDDFMVVGVGAVESGLGIAGDGALGCHVGEDHFDHLALASVAMSTGLRGSRETSEYRRNGSAELVEEKVWLLRSLSHQQLKLHQADAHVT